MRGDCYRPPLEVHTGSGRRVASYDGTDDSMSWRRDTVEERRGGRPSDITSKNTSAGNTHTTVNTGVPTGPRGRRHSTHSSLSRIDTFQSTSRFSLPSRHSSSATHAAPTLPLLSNPLPAQTLTTDEISQPQTRMNSNLTIEDQLPAKPTDPRLKGLHSQSTKIDDMNHSPSSADDGQDIPGLAASVKAVTDIVAARNESKKDYRRLTDRLERLKEDLNDGLKMFPNGNPYVEKLKSDVKSIETTLKSKKDNLEKMKKKQEQALRDVEGSSNNQESFATELQQLRADVIKEADRSKKLQDSNDRLYDKISDLTSTVNALQDQLKQRHESPTPTKHHLNQIEQNIARLDAQYRTLDADRSRTANEQHDLRKIRTEEIDNLRRTLADQKFALARLNDVFASQDTVQVLSRRIDGLNKMNNQPASDVNIPAEHFKSLVERVTNLEQRPPSSTPSLPGLVISEDYIKQADIDRYVTVFNEFQMKMEKQLRSLEDKSKPSTSDFAAYTKSADFNTYTQSLTAEQAAQQEKINRMEQQIDDIQKLVHKNSETASLLPQEKPMVDRLGALEVTIQNMQQGQLPTEGRKLQQDVSALQNLLQTHERVSKAHTHSIESLNQRFNNITTDQLARQMAGLVEPMLTTIKPQVMNLHVQFQDIQSTQTRLQAEQAALLNKMNNSDAQLLGLRTNFDQLWKANAIRDSKMNAFDRQLNTYTIDTAKLRQAVEGQAQIERSRQTSSEEDISRMLQVKLEPLERSIETRAAEIQTSVDLLRKMSTEDRLMLTTLDKGLKTHVERNFEKQQQLEQNHKMLMEKQTVLESVQESVKQGQQSLARRQELCESGFQTTKDGITEVQDICKKSANELGRMLQAGLNPLKETLDSQLQAQMNSMLESTTVTLNTAKEEREADFEKLVQQVDQARRDIEARLTIIEKALPENQDGNIGNPNSRPAHPESNTDNLRQTVARNTSSDETPDDTPKVTFTRSVHNSSASSKGRPSKSKLPVTSPLAKHFQYTSDMNDDEDTIDATPKVNTKAQRRRMASAIISISDSEQEREIVKDEDPITSSEKVDFSKWQKGAKVENSNGRQAEASNSASAEKTAQPKRKRESRPGTPRSSGQEKKKTKVVK